MANGGGNLLKYRSNKYLIYKNNSLSGAHCALGPMLGEGSPERKGLHVSLASCLSLNLCPIAMDILPFIFQYQLREVQ